MAYKLIWLADVLRAAGLNVIEHEGWKDRGRGDVGTIDAVIAHHTGPGKDENLLRLILDGRPDLAGPLSQIFLARNGDVHVLAAGRCNHAGNGSWHGASGNSDTIGIEAANAGDGKEIWGVDQMRAYIIMVAAILKHLGKDELGVAGHKEFALPRGRKIDPSFDMFAFREEVARVLEDGALIGVNMPLTTIPKQAMLRKGDRGESVVQMQKLVGGLTVDGLFGGQTEKRVKEWQKANGLVADGLFGPASWKLALAKEG